MLQIVEISFRSVRRSSSNLGRYQFKIDKTIYYPRRDVSDPDKLQKLLQVQDKSNKLNVRQVPLINYYKILGVPRVASAQQIKAAYYDLAKKYHPDANSTPQETKLFQLISEAYGVLSDESHRMEYDQYGIVRNVQQFVKTISAHSNGLRKKFKLWEKDSTINKDDKRIAPKEIPLTTGRNGTDVTLKLKFLQAVQGAKEFIELRTMVKCPKCKGSTRSGNFINTTLCQKCGGTGQNRIKKQSCMTYKQCDSCNGRRYVNSLCETCDNRGFVVQNQFVEIPIPPGTSTGDTLQITNPVNNKIVNVRITVDKSNYFKREGNNIITDKYITISQAALGGKFKIRGLYEEFEINLESGIESHTMHCFKGKGINIGAAIPGDHVVIFKIRIPKILTIKQRQLMLALAKTEDPIFDCQQ